MRLVDIDSLDIYTLMGGNEYVSVEDLHDAKNAHGRWHILPEDPNDESGAPTEEGWYRVITEDGDEVTRYYFGRPVMMETHIGWWKDEQRIILAWAKMGETE